MLSKGDDPTLDRQLETFYHQEGKFMPDGGFRSGYHVHGQFVAPVHFTERAGGEAIDFVRLGGFMKAVLEACDASCETSNMAPRLAESPSRVSPLAFRTPVWYVLGYASRLCRRSGLGGCSNDSISCRSARQAVCRRRAMRAELRGPGDRLAPSPLRRECRHRARVPRPPRVGCGEPRRCSAL